MENGKYSFSIQFLFQVKKVHDNVETGARDLFHCGVSFYICPTYNCITRFKVDLPLKSQTFLLMSFNCAGLGLWLEEWKLIYTNNSY